jgi:hypothetical protein
LAQVEVEVQAQELQMVETLLLVPSLQLAAEQLRLQLHLRDQPVLQAVQAVEVRLVKMEAQEQVDKGVLEAHR